MQLELAVDLHMANRVQRLRAEAPDHVWALNFEFDQTPMADREAAAVVDEFDP